jgi:hypothetical protein
VFLCCPGGLSTLEVEGMVVEETAESVTLRDATGTEYAIPRAQLEGLEPVDPHPAYEAVAEARWVLAGAALAGLAWMIWRWVSKAEGKEWGLATWDLAKQILPLLLAGILVSGLLLGRPGREGLVPTAWVESAVGGNSLRANAVASVAGALMYFATLTEVPILQGLIASGMGKGPALALLLAGPALSLPNMLVIRSVLGTRKTLVYTALVIVMATASGMIFGALFG